MTFTYEPALGGATPPSRGVNTSQKIRCELIRKIKDEPHDDQPKIDKDCHHDELPEYLFYAIGLISENSRDGDDDDAKNEAEVCERERDRKTSLDNGRLENIVVHIEYDANKPRLYADNNPHNEGDDVADAKHYFPYYRIGKVSNPKKREGVCRISRGKNQNQSDKKNRQHKKDSF